MAFIDLDASTSFISVWNGGKRDSGFGPSRDIKTYGALFPGCF